MLSLYYDVLCALSLGQRRFDMFCQLVVQASGCHLLHYPLRQSLSHAQTPDLPTSQCDIRQFTIF